MKPARAYPEKNRRGFAPILIVFIVILLIPIAHLANKQFIGIRYPWEPVPFYDGNNCLDEFGNVKIVFGDCPSITPSPTPSSAQPDETVYPDQIGANWKTYANIELNFEFKRPPNWWDPQSELGAPELPFTFGYSFGNKQKSAQSVDNYWITVGFISQTQQSMMGISYCGANPKDSLRCQKTQIGNVTSFIDWGTPDDKTANVSIPHPNGGIVTFQLNPVNTESKKNFSQILSTFQFLN